MSLIRQLQTDITASGTGGDTTAISGFFIDYINNVSGVITTFIGTTYATKLELGNASGVLNSKIDSVSGYLQTQINEGGGGNPIFPTNYQVISGSLFNNQFSIISGVLPYSGYVLSSTLTINNLNYLIDSYIDESDVVYNRSSIPTSGGFSIMYSGGFDGIYLKWNYNHSNGFSIIDNDTIILNYYTED